MSQRKLALSRRAALEGDAASGDYVLVDTHSATLCACNESAWRMLTKLKKGASLGDLTALLVELYGIDANAAHRDALDFVNRLSAMGLVDERE
jgi:hypothetical protein